MLNHQLIEIKIAPKRSICKKVKITMLAVAVVLVLSSYTMTGPAGLAFAAKAEGAGSDGDTGEGGKGSGGHDGDTNNVSYSHGTGKKVGETDGGGGHGPPGRSSSSFGHRESFPHPVFVGKHLIVGGPPHRDFCLRSSSNCGSFDIVQRNDFQFGHHDDNHNTVVKIVHISRNHNDRSVNFIVLTVDYTSPISGITYQAGERIPLSDFVPTVLPAPAATAAATAVATAGGSVSTAAAAAVAR